MSLKLVLFLALFAAACSGAFLSPIWGVLGYIGHYIVGPERQWWYVPLKPIGLRLSLMLATVTAIGVIIHWNSLRFGKSILSGHEKLLLLFVGIVWVLVLMADATSGRYTQAHMDHPSVKITKVVFFVLLLTHVVTELKNLDRLIWVFILGSLILGLQAWATPYRKFEGGRLEGIGGPDFTDATFFAAFQACMLPIIAAQFMRSSWWGRLLCLVSGAFTANAMILTRTRGAVVGLGLGSMVALMLAPKRHRLKVIAGLALAGIGFLSLADDQFLTRIHTVTASAEERDSSANSRLIIWRGAIRMFAANPLGVGAGNFYQNIERYTDGGQYAKFDAHNTYLRCACETGICGIAVFLSLFGSAYLLLWQSHVRAGQFPEHERHSIRWIVFGVSVSLATLMGCFLTISLIYVEYVWLLLALPICVQRVVANLESDLYSDTALILPREKDHACQADIAVTLKPTR